MSPDEQKEKQESRKFDLIVEFRLLKQKVEDWIVDHNEEAKERHTRIDKTLDNIEKILKELPCKENKEKHEGYRRELNAMWIIIGTTLGTIVIKWFQK